MVSGEALELVLPMRLDTPNKRRGHHWSARHKETKAWELVVRAIANVNLQAWSLIRDTTTRRDALGQHRIIESRRKERRRVTVIRQVSGADGLIRDSENLHFALKPLNDALKRIGLIYDDSMDWLEQPMPEQRVVAKQPEITIVRIERAA